MRQIHRKSNRACPEPPTIFTELETYIEDQKERFEQPGDTSCPDREAVDALKLEVELWTVLYASGHLVLGRCSRHPLASNASIRARCIGLSFSIEFLDRSTVCCGGSRDRRISRNELHARWVRLPKRLANSSANSAKNLHLSNSKKILSLVLARSHREQAPSSVILSSGKLGLRPSRKVSVIYSDSKTVAKASQAYEKAASISARCFFGTRLNSKTRRARTNQTGPRRLFIRKRLRVISDT